MEDENIACSPEYSGHLVNYFSFLSNHEYKNLPDKIKRYVLETHQHFKSCAVCSTGFNHIKSEFATIEGGGELFPPENFRLLKKNEKYLDDLCKEK